MRTDYQCCVGSRTSTDTEFTKRGGSCVHSSDSLAQEFLFDGFSEQNEDVVFKVFDPLIAAIPDFNPKLLTE